ncbi:hypothetical protein JJB11_02570 [Ramlibacter ginsenosidimutans]|uniref:Uncharacterized protein n=1 Tax=Ramlibacter ginsenosidimutans TaxID=502333 RepID=A0A934TPN7_9BURK|nr:hypothetical protein [Ramlibacter ginsenosidimutans]MBK6004965.1 hypothetical protein [Ramlibacter ginsenosidimutans]
MYESGQSDIPSREEMRKALARLDEALARHAKEVPLAGSDAADPALEALQRSVQIMRLEAERLRALLACD